MLRRLLLCAFVFPALAAGLACSGPSEEELAQARAIGAAREFFAACSVPGPKAREVLKMSEFRIFGQDWWFESPLAAGQPSATLLSQTGEKTYEVVIPFWCDGTDLKGNSVKLSRKLRVKVRGGVVQGYELHDEELPLLRQFGHMVVVGLGAPLIAFILILCGIPLLSDVWLEIYPHLPGFVVFSLLGGVAIGVISYTAYVCFGSTVVAVVCGAAYLMFWMGLFQLWREMKDETRRPRYY